MDHHLLAIRVFNRVVETGGFTRAADSLRMPKATVTKLIQSLEDHLQTKLFKRTTRSVSVTPEGECYYQRTVKWLAELEQMEGSMTESQSAPQGVLRIDVGGATARQLLLPALPDFIARYPQIQIDLGVGDRLIDLINDSADCVIRSGPLADSSLIARRLFELEWVTCATPAYLAHYGTPQHPCDLELGYPLAHYRHALNDRILPLHFVDRAKKSISSTAITSASTKAMRCWRRRWPDWVSSKPSILWHNRIWTAASWSACCTTGNHRLSRCMWCTLPTAI
ncbi:MAG: hypothetical protein ACFWUK_15240 [Serratia liquefaciens]